MGINYHIKNEEICIIPEKGVRRVGELYKTKEVKSMEVVIFPLFFMLFLRITVMPFPF
jgi:hypothetical protein